MCMCVCVCRVCVCTVDVGLLVQLGDAEQVCPLLVAADAGLRPGQGGLEVELVAAVSQRVSVPERLTVFACQLERRRTIRRKRNYQTTVVGGLMAERLGNRLLIGRLSVQLPTETNDVVSLGKAFRPVCLGGNVPPCTYCKSLWIRVFAK